MKRNLIYLIILVTIFVLIIGSNLNTQSFPKVKAEIFNEAQGKSYKDWERNDLSDINYLPHYSNVTLGDIGKVYLNKHNKRLELSKIHNLSIDFEHEILNVLDRLIEKELKWNVFRITSVRLFEEKGAIVSLSVIDDTKKSSNYPNIISNSQIIMKREEGRWIGASACTEKYLQYVEEAETRFIENEVKERILKKCKS